ncbi:hypothetical protein EMIHUDRAFT_101568 [Emiliania huxleyi CCMP1516]|uniref:Mitochondrial import inner membrane translocase subunit TIM22 n=2 Tax=Emiliania huxleyi TaxID=2903 RepID=A0A0D3JE01_EMIH1|nr:hypothetical protein EMIHUDRAFT_101568 [Emiliania huxleyi CCMP1516]EOD21736.1 hypothetical protein EMIHUDRAFT_101568 [Emiliania huxleyi CCMP1516]|eukprot:XP_005774165.1 hypothetical protein EMIHUDRAFT_101568 [Emiliania huxleyi CCMP1516]
MPFTFPTPWQPPVEPGQAFRESCTMQAIVSGVVGGGAGLVLGAVLTPLNSQLQQETEHLPLREQMRRGVREMGSQSRSWGKNLLVIGAVFSVSECFVEKSRGRVCCLTGGVLAAGAGPQAMGVGCAGFAAFSAAIDALGFGHFD